MNGGRHLLLRWAVGAAVVACAGTVIPGWWCGREAHDLYRGDLAPQDALARSVIAWVDRGLAASDFRTGSARFNGEWLFGAYQMASLGLMQVARQHPEKRADYLPAAERCLDRLLSAEVRAFDAEAWRHFGGDALETLDADASHAAYLGYLNVALGLHRQLAPDSRFAAWNDRITEALARRIRNSPTNLLQTYPGETYPVDNAAVAASILLHAQATGADHRAALGPWLESFRRVGLDPKTGLLRQAVHWRDGRGTDYPRASGTALACYYLGLARHELSGDLYTALRRQCFTSWLGFGLVREYARGEGRSRADIDSGPVLLGIGFSATGFSLAGARLHGDPDRFRALYRTAYAVGAPLDRDGRRDFVCGGPLGNALLLALLTAPRAAPLPQEGEPP
jgi:hypothetical protein